MFMTPAIYVLEKALDTATLRQRVIAHNIANVNTPGFKRYEVSFEEKLSQALGLEPGLPLYRTNPYHLPAAGSDLTPEVNQDNSTSMRQDGNNVDIDREMVDLAQNSLNFNFATQQLNGRLAMLRYVINEGRR
ncbi:Flagellar basal body rod protein FlgB [Neomoorella glycerini]|uniref:Flagellar basal body rod protein FlgB n=1 Tax=Neomoorella glycerini TaxID=55779 RepID=A0A6I5ZS63_9FIRM|nr:flagellar basal body rod protein FlgB [Moorella glycerini]QGP92834.1 Flagellar basal body rod protein FlgB [Moorella glycerini]